MVSSSYSPRHVTFCFLFVRIMIILTGRITSKFQYALLYLKMCSIEWSRQSKTWSQSELIRISMRFGDVIVERGGELPEMDVLFSEGHQQTSVGVQTLLTHIQSPTPPTKNPNPQTPETCKITQTKNPPSKLKVRLSL